MRRLILLALPVLLLACATSGPVRAPERGFAFDVTLSSTVAEGAVSGRLFVLMKRTARASDAPVAELPLSFQSAGEIWMSSVEVSALAPGGHARIDGESVAFPTPLAHTATGAYAIMAAFDRDGSAATVGLDAGDLRSRVIVRDVDPRRDVAVHLVLDRVVPASTTPDTERVKTIELESALVSAFRGRPTKLSAVVVLPEATPPAGAKYPIVYHFTGYGSGPRGARWAARVYDDAMQRGVIPKMIYVVLDGTCPTGHHVFADSENNGPYGRAFFEELMPEIERRLPARREPPLRFLTGQSSGGWASLWMMLSHPDAFAGVWATAPDSVDLRDFSGVDLTRDENVFVTPDGKPRNLVRMRGHDLLSFEELARLEAVLGGGPLSTIDHVFSPRGADGRPRWMWDRATGRIDPEIARAWSRWDIRRTLEARWPELGPKLRGKLHVAAGAEDNFHLEGAVRRLCAFLAERDAGGTCEVIPGADHGLRGVATDPNSYAARIAREMAAAADAAR